MGREYSNNRYGAQGHRSVERWNKLKKLYRITLWAFFGCTLTWQVNNAFNFGLQSLWTKFTINLSLLFANVLSVYDEINLPSMFSDSQSKHRLVTKIATPAPIYLNPQNTQTRLPVETTQPSMVIGSDAEYLILQADAAGHYRGIALVNQRPVRFMIDTGATYTVIPNKIAVMLGLPVGSNVQTKTAGGLVQDKATNLQSLKIGHIEIRDAYAVINDHIDEMLIGMNMLRLFQINQSNGRMILTFNQMQSNFGGSSIRENKKPRQSAQLLQSSESCAHFIHLVKDGHEVVQCIQR